jgi:hypothetical protein
MNTERARLYLVVFGALALAVGFVVELNVLATVDNQRLLGGVAIVGGLAMVITALLLGPQSKEK